MRVERGAREGARYTRIVAELLSPERLVEGFPWASARAECPAFALEYPVLAL